MPTVPNAHTLTLKFHRFLSEQEWSVVVDNARHVPFVQDLEATAVQESAEDLQRRRRMSYEPADAVPLPEAR